MSNCRSCGKEIFWQKLNNGNSNPCDPELYHIQDNLIEPNVIVVSPKGETGKLRTLESGRISHFATCPNAKIHRKAKG